MSRVNGDPRALQLQALNEIGRIATLDLDLGIMLQRITDSLARHFDWPLVALALAEPESGTFVCAALTSSIPTDVKVGYRREIGSGVVGEVAASGRSVLVDDTRRHGNYVDTAPGVLSEVCVPVKHKEELVAVLNIESTELAAFHDQLPLLETVADQIAGAVANARAYSELQQRARLMEMMSEVSREALQATNLHDFLQRVTRYIHEHFSLEIVSIRLYDAARQEYRRAADARDDQDSAQRQRSVREGIIGRCLRLGTTQLVPDVSADADYIAGHPEVVAELCIPIRHRQEILGVLNLESKRAEVFTPATVMAFEAFADQIAGALKLVSTNEELQAAKRDLQDANRLLAGTVEKLHEVSAHDSLTGLYTRRHFDITLSMEWRRCGRSKSHLSLLIADIDHFKPYNDALGHPAGDDCLYRVAVAIRETVHRAGDVVARYGGEEFAVLLAETDSESARRMAERIRQRVEGMGIRHPSAEAPTLTISVGVATTVPDGHEQNARRLIDDADQALYAAKRRGRNRVVVHEV